MAFRWRADDGHTLNAGFVTLWFFHVIRNSIAKKPYIIVIFQWGSGPPVSPFGFAHEATHGVSSKSISHKPLAQKCCLLELKFKIYFEHSKDAQIFLRVGHQGLKIENRGKPWTVYLQVYNVTAVWSNEFFNTNGFVYATKHFLTKQHRTK